MKKIDFALQHFTDHPRDLWTPGRELERRVKMSDFRTVSYHCWNEAKRLLNKPTFNDALEIEPRHTVIINFSESKVIYIGKRSRATRIRERWLLVMAYNLCVSEGYTVQQPAKGVYLMTKAVEERAGIAA